MSDETERIAQIWPVGLKEEIRERVGDRGVTKFTLEAVREKLARDAMTPAVTLPAPPIPATPPVPVPVGTAAIAPDPVGEVASTEVHPSKLLAGETRGDAVDVTTVSTGAAEEYSSSRNRVDAMLAKAREMGVKNASELPVPPPKPLVEIATPDQVMEPTPDDQLTLQEQLRSEPISTPEPAPTPVPTPVPTAVRNLDDFDADF